MIVFNLLHLLEKYHFLYIVFLLYKMGILNEKRCKMRTFTMMVVLCPCERERVQCPCERESSVLARESHLRDPTTLTLTLTLGSHRTLCY